MFIQLCTSGVLLLTEILKKKVCVVARCGALCDTFLIDVGL